MEVCMQLCRNCTHIPVLLPEDSNADRSHSQKKKKTGTKTKQKVSFFRFVALSINITLSLLTWIKKPLTKLIIVGHHDRLTCMACLDVAQLDLSSSTVGVIREFPFFFHYDWFWKGSTSTALFHQHFFGLTISLLFFVCGRTVATTDPRVRSARPLCRLFVSDQVECPRHRRL